MLALSVSKEKAEKRKRNTHKWINPTLLPLSLDMCRWSPVAVMHSDSRYHPLPKTTYHVTPGGGRQMNGPMALNVGRVKEANKQKTPKKQQQRFSEMLWGSRGGNQHQLQVEFLWEGGWNELQIHLKSSVSSHIPCELNRSLRPGFLVSCLCKRDAVERWKYVCRGGQATVLVIQPKLNCWMDYKWKANQILWLFTASVTTKTDKWGLKAV